MLKKQFGLPIFAFALLVAQCGPIDTIQDILNSFATWTPTPESVDLDIWYVAPDGNDANSCTSPSTPCLTIFGAYEKSPAVEFIVLASGNYNDTSRTGALVITHDLRIQGSGRGVSIIENAVFHIAGTGTVILDGFTMQDPAGEKGTCISIREDADVTIQAVEVTRCSEGIGHSGSGLVALFDVSVSQSFSTEFTNGTGIFNRGEMSLVDSEVGGNAANGIRNLGSLTMGRVEIKNNQLEGLVAAASSENLLSEVTIRNNGIGDRSNAGIQILDGATVSGLDVTITENGRGVRISGGESTLYLENAEINGNQTFGILAEGGEVQLTNVAITGNGSDVAGTIIGGGIENGARMLIHNGVIASNMNGGLHNLESGELTVYDTSFLENSGPLPALFNLGHAEIDSSVFAHNVGSGRPLGSDGAIENRGEMSMLNSTVSGNSDIGILVNEGSLTLAYVTIAENAGTGLAAHRSGLLVGQVSNSIIGKNNGDCDFPLGYTTYVGLNIDTDGSCGFSQTVTDDGLLLDTLADNGGDTLTHALFVGSPAIDTAYDACFPWDQRLALRPIGAACDVGAYEDGGTPGSSSAIVIPTGTPEALVLVVESDFPCYTGPGPEYNTLLTLLAGTQLEIVGYGFGGGWLVAFHPTLTNNHCWIDEDFVSLNVPVQELRLISVPPKLTSTPTVKSARDTDVPVVPTVCFTTNPNTTVCK